MVMAAQEQQLAEQLKTNISPNRILSRRDLVDGLKNSKYYFQNLGKNIFFIFRPKNFKICHKQSKNDQKWLKMKILKKKVLKFFFS